MMHRSEISDILWSYLFTSDSYDILSSVKWLG